MWSIWSTLEITFEACRYRASTFICDTYSNSYSAGSGKVAEKLLIPSHYHIRAHPKALSLFYYSGHAKHLGTELGSSAYSAEWPLPMMIPRP